MSPYGRIRLNVLSENEQESLIFVVDVAVKCLPFGCFVSAFSFNVKHISCTIKVV